MQQDLKVTPGVRVLLVEDEPLIAIDAQDALRRCGFQDVVWARNMTEAENAIGAGSFHAAVLDLRLGANSSMPLAQQLAALNVPFGFMTGFQDSALLAGFEGRPIVAKPFTHDQLCDLVQKLVTPIGS